jgi:hypothetical protein
MYIAYAADLHEMLNQTTTTLQRQSEHMAKRLTDEESPESKVVLTSFYYTLQTKCG